MNFPTNESKKTIGALFKGLLGLAVVVAPNLDAQDNSDEGEVYELSPFSVDASEDTGYRATTTLAGTRLKTNLKDVGASVSVLTREMFDDTGATDAQSILSYGLGTEVGGPLGNFAGGNNGVGSQRAEQDAVRIDPQQGQRVRGLATAQLTRNYFETDIAFDSYNTDRITINRGPNSLLFGIGSAGGVIDSSSSRASVSADFGEIGVRIGERGSHRETINYNKVLVDGRLGIRFAALNEDTVYQQRPAFEEEQRLYVALNAVLFKNEDSDVLGSTTFRANFEDGSTEGTPPNIIPPGDGISSWFYTPNPALQEITGTPFQDWVTDGSFVPKFTVDGRGLDENGTPLGVSINNVHGAVGIPYFIQMSLYYPDASGPGPHIQGTEFNGGLSRTLYGFGGRSRRTWDNFITRSYYQEPFFPGFRTASVPTSVLDNRNLLLAGTTNRVEHDFDSQNFVLEQSFFDNRAGIELAYDSQSYSTFSRLPFAGGGNDVQTGYGDVGIDVHEYLSTDEPNPNVGRLIMTTASDAGRTIGGWAEGLTERETVRATAFYELDFTENDRSSWLGRHILTGVYSSQDRDVRSKDIGAHWYSPDVDLVSNEYHFGGFAVGSGSGVLNTRMQLRSQVYFGNSLLDPSIRSIDDVKITESMNIPIPKAGDKYRMWTYNRVTDEHFIGDMELRNHVASGDLNRRTVDTEIVSLQSYLFSDNIVGLVGWRTDKQTNTPRAASEYLPSGDFDAKTNLQLGDPLDPESGNTFTWSLVGHLPKQIELPFGMDFSAHYNQSENFNPVGLRVTIKGDPLPSPSGSTEEYGFTVGALDNKFSARFNWYTTRIDNDTADLGGLARNPQFLVTEYLRRWGQSASAGMTIEEALAVSGPESVGLFSSHEEVYDEIIGLVPVDIQSVYNFRFENEDAVDDRDLVAGDPTPTRSFISEGFEVDIVGNLTDSWRFFANVAKQETVQSNIATEQLALANTIGENLRASNLKDLFDTPQLGEARTFYQRFNDNMYIPLLAGTLQEGTVSLELREWRVNVGTNYLFNSGLLSGVGIGGAVRWQSEVATGYPLVQNELGLPVPKLSSPFFGPDELNGDLWASYGRKILDDKVDWKIQLNIRNAFGDDGNIPVVTNPDGQVAIFRNPLPTEVYLSNTFKF